MKKIKIMSLQGLLFFITATQLSAAQKELLEAGSQKRFGDNSHNVFASSKATGDNVAPNRIRKKKTPRYLDEETQTDPEALGDRALVLLKDAGKSLRSNYNFSCIQDAATAAAVVSVGLRRFTNLAIKGTKLEEILILTGVLEVAATAYAMTRQDSHHHRDLISVSALCGLSSYAAFFERRHFTEPFWGPAFGIFTVGSTFGPLIYKGLQWFKKPSISTDTTLALRD